MDLTRLSLLLPVLRKYGVKRYKDSMVEMEMGPDVEAIDRIVNAPEPPNMPPDLKADDLMNEDKVLNWSAPPSPQDIAQGSEEMPLAGDAPIGGEP